MTALIEVNTADLVGEALNWAVGMAEGLNMWVAPTVYGVPARAFVNRLRGETVYGQRYDPVNDWATGGPLIDKHVQQLCDAVPPTCGWGDLTPMHYATSNDADGYQRFEMGETKLIAACRAIVAAKLGKTVSVPAELMP